MIAYRYQKKDNEWQWLQTSSRLVYKNSKPDFVICTHRQLMEEEGRDLLGKRTMDFKARTRVMIKNYFRVWSHFELSFTGQLPGHRPRVHILLRIRSACCRTQWLAKLPATAHNAAQTDASLQDATA